MIFFHEYGRHVGGVPRSSLKGKETQHDDGEKNTSKPQKATKTNQNKQPQPNTTKRPEADSPSSKQCFLCTEVRQVRKSWLHTIYGPEFATKVCQEGQCTSEEQAKPNKGASFHHQNCDHAATASSGKTWQFSFSPGADLTVSSTDSCQRESVVAMPGKPRKNPSSRHNPYN